MSKIRRIFWIIKLLKIVKKIRFNCATCKKLDKKLGEQIMAPLPMERLKPYPPFFKTRDQRKSHLESFLHACILERFIAICKIIAQMHFC